MVVHHRPGAVRRRSAPTPSRSATPSASPRSVTKHNGSSSIAARHPPRRSARRSTSPPPAGPGPVLVDVPKDVANQTDGVVLARDSVDLPGYKPTTKGHPRMIKEAAELILASRAAGDLRRRRHPQGPRGRGAARAGRADRHPRRHHADGPRRVPRRAPAVPRHAGHARQLHRRHRRCRRPTCSSPSAPASTTGSPARSPAFAPDAKIIHVDIDPAELGKVRRPDVPIVGDCRARHRGADQGDHGPEHARHGAARHVARGIDAARGWQEQLPAHLRAARAGRRAQAAVRARAAARQRARRHASSCRGVGQHQMWASQYWKFNAALHVGELRRPRHDGLRGAGRDRRQGRPARPHGVGRRRRRLLPDDRAGAGDRVAPSASRSRSPSSTTPTSAWCASGRRCSTRSATARCTCRPTCPTT